jgi:hypothetical protein
VKSILPTILCGATHLAEVRPGGSPPRFRKPELRADRRFRSIKAQLATRLTAADEEPRLEAGRSNL